MARTPTSRNRILKVLDHLPRLAPRPVPAIHAVPEHAATGRLASVYERTKKGFDVPWMGVVAMAFAHYPRFYDTLWTALDPLLASQSFAEACRDLRQCAEGEALSLQPAASGLIPQLQGIGYTPHEIDEIRGCIEVFAAGNMPYVLMATLARALLEGHEWSGGAPLRPVDAPSRGQPKPPLMEAHHADPATRALYDDIKEVLGLPFVNTDYRALARWPSYAAQAWAGLRPIVRRQDYSRSVEHVHQRAVALSLNLPNPSGATSAALQDAAEQDASLAEVLDVVRLFQWLLPGLITNVAILERQIAKDALSG